MTNEIIGKSMEDFQKRLKDLMLEKGVNNKLLSQEIKCTAPTISYYVNAKRFPTLQNFIKLADYFNCSVDYLYGLEDTFHATHYLSCPPFSERLKFLLSYFNTKKKDFCIEADICETNFFDWLKDKSEPKMESIYKIAKYFDCSMDFVLGREA